MLLHSFMFGYSCREKQCHLKNFPWWKHMGTSILVIPEWSLHTWILLCACPMKPPVTQDLTAYRVDGQRRLLSHWLRWMWTLLITQRLPSIHYVPQTGLRAEETLYSQVEILSWAGNVDVCLCITLAASFRSTAWNTKWKVGVGGWSSALCVLFKWKEVFLLFCFLPENQAPLFWSKS